MNYPSTTLTRRDRSMGPLDQLARGLGWFSLGLGLTELIAGGALARWLGLKDHEPLIRAYGVRELLAGKGASPSMGLQRSACLVAEGISSCNVFDPSAVAQP